MFVASAMPSAVDRFAASCSQKWVSHCMKTSPQNRDRPVPFTANPPRGAAKANAQRELDWDYARWVCVGPNARCSVGHLTKMFSRLFEAMMKRASESISTSFSVSYSRPLDCRGLAFTTIILYFFFCLCLRARKENWSILSLCGLRTHGLF